MKSLIAAASAAAVVAIAAPALAQSPAIPQVSTYVDLGYSYAHTDGGPNYSVLGGRLGATLGRYIGVEGEVNVGLNRQYGERVDDTYAGYLVGRLPVNPSLNLFARVGYGHTDLSHYGDDSVNIGAGAEYFVTAHDGVRFDYTSYQFRNYLGAAVPDSNVFGISYVRRF